MANATNSQIRATSDHKQSVPPVLQKFFQKRSEVSDQQPNALALSHTLPSKTVENKSVSSNEGYQYINESVIRSSTLSKETSVLTGKNNLPSKFSSNPRNLTDLTKTLQNDNNPKKNPKPEIKQRNEQKVQHTNTTIEECKSTLSEKQQWNKNRISVSINHDNDSRIKSQIKSPPVQSQSRNSRFTEQTINFQTKVLNSADLKILHQKCSGKKFKEIRFTSKDSDLPVPPKAALPSHLDLFNIRQQYHKVIARLEECQTSGQDESEYVINDVDVTLSKRSDTTYKLIQEDITAQEESEPLYHDGYTLLPTCEPDDGLYLEAITMRKPMSTRDSAINEFEDDGNMYVLVDKN